MAASNSRREALYHLGLLYEKGLSVFQDYYKAIQLYNQVYQLGNDDTLHRLGTLHHHGKGLDINLIKTIEYYTRSAELRNQEYQCELGRLYEEGKIVSKNILQTLKWYTDAYLQGYNNINLKLYPMYDYEPYEGSFWKKLFRILLAASRNPFGLGENDNYEHYVNINNRLGALYFYGQGIEKNFDTTIFKRSFRTSFQLRSP